MLDLKLKVKTWSFEIGGTRIAIHDDTCPGESSYTNRDYQSAARKIYGGQLMKKTLFSVVLALALGGTTAVAEQNKNKPAPKAPAKAAPAAAPSTGTMKAGGTTKKKRHHKKKKAAATTTKAGNKNK